MTNLYDYNHLSLQNEHNKQRYPFDVRERSERDVLLGLAVKRNLKHPASYFRFKRKVMGNKWSNMPTVSRAFHRGMVQTHSGRMIWIPDPGLTTLMKAVAASRMPKGIGSKGNQIVGTINLYYSNVINYTGKSPNRGEKLFLNQLLQDRLFGKPPPSEESS